MQEIEIPQSFAQIHQSMLHPASVREIGKGHFWITKDSFSDRFPKEALFLAGLDKTKRPCTLFLNDPDHKTVKGRVWSRGPFRKEEFNFEQQLQERILLSLEKRLELSIHRERENLFLIFGEADQLPGLFLLQLGTTLVVQLYSTFWTKLLSMLLKNLQVALEACFPNEKWNFLLQVRNTNGKAELTPLAVGKKKGKLQSEIVIQEFGVNYLIQFEKDTDFGLYTDMAAIRKQLTNTIGSARKVLNLFAYTGAYSLFALKHGAKQVVSVDLSKKNIDWLEQNLSMNPELGLGRHSVMVKPVQKALKQLALAGETFDLILCDPPSSSSDGKKMSSSLSSYKELLPQMIPLVEPGGYLLVFLNTHKVTLNRFRTSLEKIIQEWNGGKTLTEVKLLGLNEDCPTVRGFPEGSYLKGVLFQVQ